MALDTDFRVMWDTTNASIPANWSEDTNFVSRYLQGGTSGFTGSTNSGAATHLHATTNHTHTANGHTHFFSSASTSSETPMLTFTGTAYTVSGLSHLHKVTSSNAGAPTYQNASLGNTSSDAMQPPSVRMIIISPDDALQEVPDGAFTLTDETTAPAGYTITGSGGTNDWDGKFILGATNGGDGGGTLGSATHNHTKAGTHTHTINSHSHIGSFSGTNIRQTLVASGAKQPEVPHRHHKVTMVSKALADLSSDAIGTISSESNEPAYVKLLGIFNTSGGASTPDNLVLPFVGDISGGLPSGWTFVNSTSEKQIKITKTGGEVEDTGGSDSHTHTGSGHGHTHTGSHNHTTSYTNHEGQFLVNASTSFNTVVLSGYSAHVHTWSVGSTTPTLQNASISTASSDGRYDYRTVAFLKKTAIVAVEQPAIFYGCNF